MTTRISGIGMTSQRTRDRMINRLREQGIMDELVLAAMLEIPRHFFLDEALATRAYEDAFAAAPQLQIVSAACPEFVEFVEAGVPIAVATDQ